MSARFNDQLLIAMPSLADPNFSRTVTLICEHNERGALGVVVNRTLELHLSDLLEHLDMHASVEGIADAPVYAGGPVRTDHGFVLHSPLGAWDATLGVNADLGLTSSLDILASLAAGDGPSRYLAALGYAGWGPGQLEREMGHNAWLSVPSDPAILFDLPADERWQAAARRLGVDLNLLAGDAGHA